MQDTDLIKTTPLQAAQAKAGAVFASFDGWYLPRTFGDQSREYAAAREGAAVVDRSNFGRLRITGADSLDLLNRLSTNNLIDLGPNEGASTVLTTNKGRIIDLLLVVARLGGELLVVTSPRAAEKVVEWIDLYTFGEDIAVQDVTEETALLSVVGPSAGDLLGPGVRSLGLYGACEIDVAGVRLSAVRTDAFGTIGYDVLAPASQAEEAWDALARMGAVPMGEDAAETLRVEQGVPRYGRELGEEFNPLEAELLSSISFDKGCYIGQEVVVRLNTYDKVQKRLVGVALDGGGPEPEARLEVDGKEVGFLTSVVESPLLGHPLALGYVRRGYSEAGQEVDVRFQGRLSKGRMVELPIERG